MKLLTKPFLWHLPADLPILVAFHILGAEQPKINDAKQERVIKYKLPYPALHGSDEKLRSIYLWINNNKNRSANYLWFFKILPQK